MTNAKAITVIKTDPPQEREDEWNEWYTNVHSPGRFECGFLAFRRFEIVPDQPQVDTRQGGQAKYLAIMELPDTSVLTGPAYDAVTERWTATPPDSFEHQTMKLPKLARGVLELIGCTPTTTSPCCPRRSTCSCLPTKCPRRSRTNSTSGTWRSTCRWCCASRASMPCAATPT